MGTKATVLGRLAEAGIPVPDFFVVTSAAFASHLDANGVVWPDSPEALADTDRLGALRREIAEGPVPDAVRRPTLEAYETLSAASGHDHVAGLDGRSPVHGRRAGDARLAPERARAGHVHAARAHGEAARPHGRRRGHGERSGLLDAAHLDAEVPRLDHHHRSQRRWSRAQAAVRLTTRTSDTDGPVDATLFNEARARVEDVLARLPLKQRLAFTLRKLHDLDYPAIAESLGCSPESARANVFQALRKIRHALNGIDLGVPEDPR